MTRKIGIYVTVFLLAVVAAEIPHDWECHYHPEIMVLNDMSTSFHPYMDLMAKVVDDVKNHATREFGRKASLGLSSFIDMYRPDEVYPSGVTGGKNDYCANVDMKIQHLRAPGAWTKPTETIKNLVAIGGGDFMEGLNLGVYRIALSPNAGWSNVNATTDRDLPGGHLESVVRPGWSFEAEAYDDKVSHKLVRIMLVLTDAPIHEDDFFDRLGAVDDLKCLPESFPEPDPTLIDSLKNGDDVNHKCHDVNYPTVAEVRDALKYRNIIPIFLIIPPKKFNETLQAYLMKEEFTEWLAFTGRTDDTNYNNMDLGLEYFYRQYLAALNVKGFVYTLNERLNIGQVIDDALKFLPAPSCEVIGPGTVPPPNNREPGTQTADETTNSEPAGDGSSSTTTAALAGGGGSAAVIGSASAVVGIVGVAGLAAKALGFGPFAPSALVDNTILQDVENVEGTQDREQFEAVTGDLFS